MLNNIKSDKSIEQRVLPKSYLEISPGNPEINPLKLDQGVNLGVINSDRKGLKLKKISSSPYINDHQARLRLVMNKVKSINEDTSLRIDNRKYTL